MSAIFTFSLYSLAKPYFSMCVDLRGNDTLREPVSEPQLLQLLLAELAL